MQRSVYRKILKTAVRPLDYLLCLFVIGPLVVIFWRSVWIAPDMVTTTNQTFQDTDNEKENHMMEPKKLRRPIFNNWQSLPTIQNGFLHKENKSVEKEDFQNTEGVRRAGNIFLNKIPMALIQDEYSFLKIRWAHRHAQVQMRMAIAFFVMGTLASILAVLGQHKMEDLMVPYHEIGTPVRPINKNAGGYDLDITNLPLPKIGAYPSDPLEEWVVPKNCRDNNDIKTNNFLKNLTPRNLSQILKNNIYTPLAEGKTITQTTGYILENSNTPTPSTDDEADAEYDCSGENLNARNMRGGIRSTWKKKVIFPIYAYIMAVMVIFQWRGLWNLLNIFAGTSMIPALVIFLVGMSILAITRTINNCVSVPLNVFNDWNSQEIFLIPTFLKTHPDKDGVWYFFIDSLITVCILNNSVVLVWNGGWNLLQGLGILLGVPSSYWVTLYSAAICIPLVIITKVLLFYTWPTICYTNHITTATMNEKSKNILVTMVTSSKKDITNTKNKYQEVQDGGTHNFNTHFPRVFQENVSFKADDFIEGSIVTKSQFIDIYQQGPPPKVEKVYKLKVVICVLIRYSLLFLGFIGVLTYWIGIWLLLDYYIHFEYLMIMHWISFLALVLLFATNSLIFRGVISDEDFFNTSNTLNTRYASQTLITVHNNWLMPKYMTNFL